MAAPSPAASEKANSHTISVFVNNKPGVLVRVALVFSRRGYNIESLVVSPAARGEFSRMTIVCTGDSETLEQIIKQLSKLIDVVHAIDHTEDGSVETEIALIKVESDLSDRTQVLQIAEHYNAKVVDYAADSLMLRVYGSSEKLDAVIELLRPYGLLELVRSGKILMTRGVRPT